MRFLLPAIALLFLGFIGFSSADLRFASTPDTRFAVRNRDGSVAFSTTLALYMEPNTFGYQGLRNQKQNNYDNFLRSNIDNEQDNRNFNQEAGKDHLPFRTFEAKATDETNQLTPSVQLTVEPGKEYVLPLRWNNPHASEMELNIWIMDNTIVVPIKRPVCSGEGYQDGVISFIVPKDFNDLGSKVAGFTGCNSPGDCVLQMYAHSVEPRTYAAGTPIIVVGFDPSKPKAADNSAVKPKTQDPGTDLSKQPNEVCLPSTDASSNIASAVPQWARHVSDVFNHAYQNSDYSPYSGQQHEYISKTMQAACVLRMVNGNRGELGASILTQEQKNTLQNLRNAADNLVNNYEQLTNQIINQVLKNNAKTSGKAGDQQLNNCFRCLETASVSNNRQETNTYVPSFKIANQNQLAQARQIAQNRDNGKYAKLINANGVVQIYIQALTDMAPAYQQLQAKYGLGYQPAREKVAASTMPDISAFKKINANGGNDGGKYAATQAKAALAAEKTAVALPSGEIIIQSARWTDRALNAAGQHSAFTGTATADQKFVWKSTGQIQIAGTNKCLDVSGVLVTVDGTKIIPWDCDATGMKANQVFYRRGAKMIQIPSTTKCIDTTNVNDVGTSFHIWECADTNQNQQFNILDAVTGAAVPATKSSSFDDTSMVFNGLDIEGSSFFGANFDISTLDANAIGLLNIGGGLAPNADDDPKKQNGYDDREDAINGLSIKQTDAALADSSSSSSSSSSSGMSSAMSLGIGAAGGALLTALIAGGIIFKMKKQNQAQNTNNRVFADARV